MSPEVETARDLYRRYAYEDRIAAAEYGGMAAGAMMALRFAYLDAAIPRQTISEDLCSFWAKIAANCAHAAQTWEEHLRVVEGLQGDESAILAHGFSGGLDTSQSLP